MIHTRAPLLRADTAGAVPNAAPALHSVNDARDATIYICRGSVPVLLDADDADIGEEHYLYLGTRRSTKAVMTRNKQTGKHTALARLLLQTLHHEVADHINGNPLDNRRCNLRIVTWTQNNRNRAKAAGCSSQYKGVSRMAGYWASVIHVAGKQVWLGSHATEIDAAKSYDEAVRQYFGGCGTLNFPADGEQWALRPLAKSYITHEQHNDA